MVQAFLTDLRKERVEGRVGEGGVEITEGEGFQLSSRGNLYTESPFIFIQESFN